MTSIKKFAVHFSHFLTGNLLVYLLGVISFPILTRVLSREEYGIMSLVTTTLFFAVAFSKAGLSDGIIRFYAEYDETPERRTVFSSTIMVRGFVFSLAAVFIYVAGILTIRGYSESVDKYLVCFLVMSVPLLVRPLNIIVLNVFRATGKTILYSLTNLVGKILSIVFSLVLLIYLVGQFYGYFVGLAISEVILSAMLFYWFFKNYRIELGQVSKDLTMKLVKFGLPLLFSELSYLLLNYIDRYMIVVYYGEGALGLYSVGYNLASYISDMFMFSLSAAVIPIYVMIYEKEGREKTEVFLQSCMRYVLIAIIPMVAGYYAISSDLFITLASQTYAPAAVFSPIILMGSLLLGMNGLLNAGLYLKKKSKTILAIMFVSMLLNVALNMLLLPEYGVMGASVATLGAAIFSTVATTLFSFRHIVVRVNLKTIVYYSLLSAIMYIILTQFAIETVWLNLAAKMLAGSLFIGIGVLVMEKEIRARLKGLIL